MAKIDLRLYVTGLTPSAAQAIACTRALQERLGIEEVSIAIVDVLDQPRAALEDDVYATPTLFRLKPGPVRRVFGSFASVQTLIESLQLES